MIPTPHVLQVKRQGTSGTDHGNPVEVFGDPQDWHVHAVGPGAMLEPGEPNRDVSYIAYTVLAPVSAELPTEHDRVVYLGDEYTVNGRPADWSKGPWRFPTAGVVVELRRVEG